LDGVAGMMEIVRYELYLIRVQLFDVLEKYLQLSLNLEDSLIAFSLRATKVQTILKDSLLVGFWSLKIFRYVLYTRLVYSTQEVCKSVHMEKRIIVYTHWVGYGGLGDYQVKTALKNI
jgi:hypothetical protein